jgi:deazaflavin-dependent oxidoreductase (nitroreductase family)
VWVTWYSTSSDPLGAGSITESVVNVTPVGFAGTVAAVAFGAGRDVGYGSEGRAIEAVGTAEAGAAGGVAVSSGAAASEGELRVSLDGRAPALGVTDDWQVATTRQAAIANARPRVAVGTGIMLGLPTGGNNLETPRAVGRFAAWASSWRVLRGVAAVRRAVGRRSGQPRVAIVGYLEDGPNLITLAMNGWAEAEPAWWLNLQAQPDTTVEMKDGLRAVHGRAAGGEERDRLWARWRELSDDYDAWAAMRTGPTAVVVLEPRIEEAGG